MMVKGFIFFRDGKIPFVIENYHMELFTDDPLLDDFCKEYNFKENYILHGQCFDIGIRGRKATFLVENSMGSTCYLRCYTINMFDKDEEYDSIGLQSPSLDEVFRYEYEYIDMVRAGINLAIEPKVVYKVPFGMNDQKYELEFRIGHDNRLGLLEDLDRKCELILPLHTNEIQECYDITIASRDLIDTHPLFARDRLLDSRTKAIPENNGKAFTTIITFYECNLEILWILLKDMDVLNSEGTKTKGKGKIKEFIRKRPNDETIHQFEELCGAFWNALIERFEDIYTYAAAEPNAQPYRNRAGGNLLFRPVALLPFVRAAVKVSIQQKKDFDEIFGDFPQELLYIDNIIWRNTLWNSDKGTMIVNNQKLTERILLYYWDRSTLTAKEISTMKLEIKSNLQLADMEDVETLLADAIDK